MDQPTTLPLNDQPNWRLWLIQLRVHQWSKNILLLIPMIVAHQVASIEIFFHTLLGILCFCCVSSAIYIINDIVDREKDRLHPCKSSRPLAANLISQSSCTIVAIMLALLGFAFSLLLPGLFSLTLGCYFGLCILYSFYLKKLLLLDVSILAILYTLRILAGCAATGIVISHWLLVFSIFVFFGFATLKRIIELNTMHSLNLDDASGRAYHVDDRPMLMAMGISACYLGVLVLCLYINQPQTLELYSSPAWLWAICMLLLYWLNRLWLLAHRSQLPADPILFAIKDLTSYTILVLSAVFLYLAV